MEFRVVRWLARLHRKRLKNTTFVGITGSAAKTTTKLLATAILSTEGRCRLWRGTANNYRFIMNVVLGTKIDDDFAVVEFSAERPGYLDAPLELVKPRIGVVTSIGLDNLKTFGSAEAIAREKAKIISSLPQDGVAILNADDPLVKAMEHEAAGQIVTFGQADDADFCARDVQSNWPQRLSFTLDHKGQQFPVSTQLCGVHWVSAILSAIAIGDSAGIPTEKAIEAIQKFTPMDSRMEPVTVGDVTFVLDDWKAPLWSLSTVFEFLEGAQAQRKIIVIGTISNYGGPAGKAYLSAAERALEIADHVIFVGAMATHGLQAKRAGNEHKVHVFPNVRDADTFFSSFLQSGDLVLLKGSSTSDHLGRLLYDRLDPISCWRMDCGKTMLCTSCPQLRSGRNHQTKEIEDEPKRQPNDRPDIRPSMDLPKLKYPMTVVVGIGNPGARNENTPHNIGFSVLDAAAARLGLEWHDHQDAVIAHDNIGGKTVLMIKPQKYVNFSGKVIKSASEELGFSAEDCIVVQDDAHLPLGKIRIRARGSDGGHKGVLSMLIAFQSNEIRRLKIGVAPAEKPNSMANYLTTPFDSDVEAVIAAARDTATQKLVSMLENT